MTLFDPPPNPGPPDDTTPLAEARAWLQAERDAGVHCPCCDQFAKVYKRTLPAAPARVMIAMYRLDEGREWLDLVKLRSRMTNSHQIGGYGTLAHLWGLMEPMPALRDDGSTRNGWWRLTDPGREFVTQLRLVRKFAHIYNAQCIGLSGPLWSIRDALGTKFNYDELMRG